MTSIEVAASDEVAGVPDLRHESPQVRSALSALGRLLGAALVEPVRDLPSFVTRHLGVANSDIAMVKKDLPGADASLVYVQVGQILARSPRTVIADDRGWAAPGYDLIEVGVDELVTAPSDLAAYLPASEGLGFDVVLVLTDHNDRAQIQLHARRNDVDFARAELAALIERARGAGNFYRGRFLRMTCSDWQFTLTPVAPVIADRTSVVHSDRVWAEVEANVTGLARHGDTLLAAGLGASRGILLAGPPGVGKTALCRVIANELPAGTTIVTVDSAVTAHGLSGLYDSLHTLAPAAVFLDDIDLIAGDRRGHAGPVLRELLTHLDGFRPSAPVLTVATTNASKALDAALIRPGRFDALIEILPPDREARAEILRRCLAPIAEIDVRPLAAATDGVTGADLREIVRRTVLERGSDLTVAAVLDVIHSGRWKPAPATGQYL